MLHLSDRRSRDARHTCVLAALVLLSAGCGSGAVMLPDDPARTGIPAEYPLQAVNGKPLPFTISQTPDRVDELLSGVLTLKPGARYSASITVRRRWLSTGVTNDTVATSAGHYQVIGNDLVLGTSSDASTSFEISDGGRALRGPGLPSAGPSLDILREYLFHR